MCPKTPETCKISVLYTGTQAPTFDDPRLRIHHRPMLRAHPLDFDQTRVRELARRAKTLVFYSPNSVEILADSGVFLSVDLPRKTIWAVGEKTAEALNEYFGVQAFFPADQQFAGMLKEFAANPPALPLVAFGIDDSPRSLIGASPGQFGTACAADVHEISVYQTVPRVYPDLGDFMRKAQIGWIAFGSPRGVSTLLSQVEATVLDAMRFAAIGPTTAGEIQRQGLTVNLCLKTPDRDLMMLEILKYTAPSRPPA